MIKIDVWSDFVCPFCYIGSTRLQRVLGELNMKAEVVYHSFELDPTVKATGGSVDMIAYITNKLGTTKEQAIATLTNISNAFEQEGLVYNYNKSIMVNTRLAHQLIYFAKEHNSELEDSLRKRLFKAHFEDGLDIGNIDVLLELATEVGLHADNARKALNEGVYENHLNNDKMQSQMYGVSSVPQFIINDKYKVVGSQSAEYFKEALVQINKEFSKNITTLPTEEDGACGDDGCAI